MKGHLTFGITFNIGATSLMLTQTKIVHQLLIPHLYNFYQNISGKNNCRKNEINLLYIFGFFKI